MVPRNGVSSAVWKVVWLAVATAVLGAAIGFYITVYLQGGPSSVTYQPTAAGGRTTKITLQTVAAIGRGAHPDWVSYFARNQQGTWEHSTILKVPAHSLIHVTVYNFDGASGLRNPFFGQPRGLVGGTMNVDGKTLRALKPDDASHTFTIPDLGVSVPLAPVGDNAPNQCSVAPCKLSNAHRTIKFTFRTGAPGKIRWQCFVPCAAGFILGFGGPMQTVGYMDGFLEVV
jgi:hypothetical protein